MDLKLLKTVSCPDKVHPLIFAQMCTLYHQGKTQTQSTCPLHLIAYKQIQSINLLHLLTLFQKSLLQRLTSKLNKIP